MFALTVSFPLAMEQHFHVSIKKKITNSTCMLVRSTAPNGAEWNTQIQVVKLNYYKENASISVPLQPLPILLFNSRTALMRSNGKPTVEKHNQYKKKCTNLCPITAPYQIII